MSIGVDAFDGNGLVDWAAAKNSGNVTFALLRAAEATVVDTRYTSYAHQCALLGIKTGAFLFFHWGSSYSPESQAATLLNVMGKPDKTGFPPTIDVEKVTVAPAVALDALERCVRVVHDAIGVWPMIYTSKVVCEDPTQLANILAGTALSNCPLWIKYWPFPVNSQAVYVPSMVNALSAPTPPAPWYGDGGWVIEQYQGDAINMHGFSNPCDMNRLHVVQQGDSNSTVKLVQRCAGELTVDGSFGPKTAARIRELQLAAGQSGDGIVGLNTWPLLLWKNF